jgi:TonB family protein
MELIRAFKPALPGSYLSFRLRFALLVACGLCAAESSFAQPPDANVSSRVRGHLDDAQACLARDDLDCARASLNNIPTQNSSKGEQYRYWQSLAWVEFLDGHYPEAIEGYGNAAALSWAPQQRELFLRYVAQLHASMGQFQEAYDTLEELLARNGAIPMAGQHMTAYALWRGMPIYLNGDYDLVPAGTNPPAFPAEAVTQGLRQGHVTLEFTVTRTGATKDIRVVEASAPVFGGPAIEAAERFRYKPRLVDGNPVETVVQHRIEFQSEDSD